MIQYDQKYVFKKMCDTVRSKHLEYHGPYQLRILKKKLVGPPRGYHNVTPVFYVETDDNKYHGMLEVTQKEYDEGRVGHYFGWGGIILNTKRGCYYMSKYNDPMVAISKAVNSAKLRFVFLGFVICLFVVSCILMILKLL